MRSFSRVRGMTLIDVLVGSALVVIVFMGLFGLIRASLAVSTVARLKNTATALATTQMEYLRSLPYDSVGTDGGIPAGLIPQYATTTDQGTLFTTRTYIEYADDAADGLGAADVNGIMTDYKHLKVSTTYVANGISRDVTLVSNMAPPGVETTTGGGTLQATVVGQSGAPVAGASVRVVNASTTPDIDVTTFSDASGLVQLPGAATSTEYQIYVSKNGYSSAQTYKRDAVNANPNPGYLTITTNHTTASTFAIDLLTSITLKTYTATSSARFQDLFNDSSKIVASTSIVVTGGAVVLSGAAGTYASLGTVRSTTTAPGYLATWVNASTTNSKPASTNILVSVTDGSGTLIPDAALPGNSGGFTGIINLSGVSTTTYPALALKATLSTSDVNATPSLADWALGYTAGPVPLPNIALTLTGSKTTGSTSGGIPIYKTTVSTTTDATGTRTLTLEWDVYQLAITGHTLVSSDVDPPFDLLPGTATTSNLILTP